MSVKINGMEKLKSNYFRKLIIREDPVFRTFKVKVEGEKIKHKTETIGDRFGEEFKEKKELDQVVEIIEDYIRNTKICGFTDLITLQGYGNQRFNVIYGDFGYREMVLQLFHENFREVYNKIKAKFYQDRFDFCYAEKGIKTFKISTNSTGSAYNINLEELYKGAKEAEYFKHITLKENNFVLIDSEKKFIGDFIINVFSKFGEFIEIEKVYNKEYEWTRKDVIGFIFRCGDVKIYIDNSYPLLYILVMVGNYNLSLKSEKENCMKRQLKMEEI